MAASSLEWFLGCSEGETTGPAFNKRAGQAQLRITIGQNHCLTQGDFRNGYDS
ncbi:hypothetical protein PAMP_022980 [Pampus punctatissimus]